MKKILFFLCMAMFMNMPCFAEKFSVEHDDGNSNTTTITYEITSDNTVSVVSGESPYAGNIVIPENVTNNEIQYAVTAIGNSVFNGCANLTSVTIPNSVVSIGSAAFQNCTHLATVQLGNSVKTISSYAFSGCDDLTSVELPNSLETIGTRAFQSCDKLESVSFGESIKSIQEATFSSCTSLNKVIFPNISTLFNIEFVSYSSNPLPIAKHIYVKDENGGETEVTDLVIPEGVTEIPNEFFKDVASITSITIPSSVTLIGDNAFAGCTNLATVTFPESSINMGKDVFANTAWISNHQSDDNVVYIGSVLYQYKGEMQENTTITVKDGTTSIAEGAFKNQTNLVNITIPESVTHIGKDAFTGTTWYNGLADGPIYINKVLYKYKGTMQANTTIEVTEGTVNIAEGAFENFTQLTKVVLPNSVTTLEKAAFSGCTGLSDLTIGDAIATIGDDAFKSCNNLSKIHVSSGDRMFGILYGDAISWGEGQANPFTLAKHLYVGDTEVTEVTLPEDMITEINQGFFHNFGKNVTSLTIPGSVTTIGDAAFQDWTNLVSVTIGESVESIGANAFKGCTKLESIEIPNSVLSIGERAFESCSALSNVTIGNGVETIGQYAFNSCSALTNITIGNSVKTIGNWAFNGCNNLRTVNVNTLLTVFNVERGNANNNPFSMVSKLCLNGEEITTELVIPEGVAEINNGFFYNFYKTIETVTISDSVKTIGQYAFQGWPALTTVTLGNSVDSIASGAFQNCSKLESITLGDSIAFVGTNAFSGCNSLQQVHVTNLDKWYAVQFGNESANPLTLAKHLYYNGNEVTSVVIPEGITEINQSFFKGYENIKSIVLPNSVVKIGDYAFSGLSNLESVTLSSSLETIGTSAFQNCTALTAIEIPNSVKTFPNEVFRNCTNLASVVLGDSLRTIGQYAFRECRSLESVIFPNSVVSIGYGAFEDCTNLSYITLGDSVKSIDWYAFNRCDNFQIVNVTKLETMFNIQCGGNNANPFTIASKLHLNGEEVTELVIPKGIKELNNGFFYNFKDNVTSVTINTDSLNAIGGSAFQGWPKLASATIGGSVKAIGHNAFENCSALTSVTIGDSVKTVEYDAFKNTGLTSVTFPNSLVMIGDRAFKGLANLESVTLSDSLETIGAEAFQNCTALTAIEIPNLVKSIGHTAFNGCTNLAYVTLGDSVKSIGDWAFDNCTSLQTVNVNKLETIFNIQYNGARNPFVVASRLHLNGEEVTDLVIPEGVTEIKKGFLYNFGNNVTSVTIPNSVKIGDYAFQNWPKLESVSLERTGKYAFEGCSALTSITLGASVDTIATGAFRYCKGLESVVIPNTVVTIEKAAFEGCTKLSSVTFGDAIASVGSYAFNGCDSLKRVDVTNLDTWYAINFENQSANPLTIAQHLYFNGEEVTGLNIPEGITEINEGFFKGYENIKSITLPKSVKKIGYRAFYNLTNLESVTLNDSLQSIGEDAFMGCTALTAIDIPNSVKTFARNVFYGCTSLSSVTLGDSLQTIGGGSFNQCKNLKSIVIPNSVVTIEDRVFEFCTNLSYITLGDSLKYIKECAFNGCDSLRTVNINKLETMFNMECNSWEGNPFSKASKLHVNGKEITDLVIPEGVTDIKNGFFYNFWENVTSVTIPNSVKTIGGSSFHNWSKLTSVTIGDSVKTIEYSAFQNTGLTSVEFPNSLEFIRYQAFNGCANLESISFGDSIKTIEENAFNGCEKLAKVNITNIATLCNIAFANENSNPLRIAKHLYLNGKEVTELVIPESVTQISPYAFIGASSLTTVTIPNTVKSIGHTSFNGCTNLAYITLGDSLKYIKECAFNGCDSLRTVNINKLETMFNMECNSWEGNPFSKASKLHVNGKEITDLVIPEGITTINKGFFYNFGGNITSVTIPNSVKEIGQSAFEYWSKLKSVYIGNSVKTIGALAFLHCSELSYISLGDSVINFGTWAFEECDSLTINVTKLETLFNKFNFADERANPFFWKAKELCVNNEPITDLVVPNTVKEIPGSVFYGSNIKSLVIPNSVETIGNNAFTNCKGLTSLEIPNSVKMIGDDAFNGCEKLALLSLGNSVDTIGARAFANCKALTSLEIPNSVTTISKEVFDGCNSLSSVTLGNSLNYVGYRAFANCNTLTSIEIPNSVNTLSSKVFENCNNLSNITLGSSIKTMGYQICINCFRLTQVTIPSTDWLFQFQMKSSGDEMFYVKENSEFFKNLYVGKQPLTTLEIPNNVVDASIIPMLYNSNITSLNTGNGLETLPKGRSEKITNLTLGSNITKIEGEFPNALIVVSNTSTPPTISETTFPKCMFDNGADGVVVLPNVDIEKEYLKKKYWDKMQLTNQSNKVDVLVNTPGELSWEIFDKHNMAPAKVVGLTVRGEINDKDFEQMNKNMVSLLYLDLSNAKVNKVPDNAFDGKQQLLSLQLPSTTKVVGNYAFQGCHGIEELVLPTDLTEIGDGAFAGTNIETLDFNYALQKIGNRAFANTPLKEIYFQNKVESIGSEAFRGCNLTQELYFSETLTSIGERAFEGQSGITGHLTIPESVTTVGQRAFSSTNISTVFISGKMTTLESGVFANCPQLNVVYIPDNITRINASAFQGCTSLKDLRLSQKVEEIEREAFRAIPIRSVSVPENVKTLREYTFADCANLRFATLPSTITKLDEGVFYNCRQLMNLTVKALTPPTVEVNTFRGVNTDRCIVSIPTESRKDYALATYWGRFLQMRNDIAVQKKGNGTISFASGETAEEGNTPAPVTRATRAATNETESTMTTVENGSSLYVPKDGTVRFYITPEEGEELVSATFDGEDITSQIVDGVFVTTADKQSAELVVNFSELSKTAQVITWNQEFEQPVMVGDKITLNAAASSGLSVNFAFGNNESSQFANLNDNTLAIVKPGAIALIAQQKGDDEYASISTDVKYIQAYEYGDANGNREINSADLATTIDYAIGNDPQEFLFRAADVNKDQRVNVADVSGVVDIVLTAPATIDEAELMTRSTGEVLRGEMSANGLNVILSSNMGEYLTFQCDIRLSDDCLPKLDEAGNPVVTLRNSEAAGTQVAVARFVEEGCIRMLLYSTDNTPMTNNQTLTLQMESVSKNGDIEIENAGYSFRENEAIVYRPFEYGFVTGMEGLEDVISSMKIKTQGEEISIYSPVDYQLPVTSVDGIVHMLDVKAGYNKFALKQGVYIIGKNKVIIK